MFPAAAHMCIAMRELISAYAWIEGLFDRGIFAVRWIMNLDDCNLYNLLGARSLVSFIFNTSLVEALF